MIPLPDSYTFDPIGNIYSPFKQKFGIPRQPGLTPDVKSSIILNADYSDPDIIDALVQSTHIWILFVFSACYQKGWKNKVRPPRLGGNQKVGVFATRSPFRPNPIGISAVKLSSIRTDKQRIIIDVLGADLMDGTPVLDIKPYIPYSDCITDASNALADSFSPLQQPIFYSAQAQKACELYALKHQQQLSVMIEQVLRCDPRPAYQKEQCREYGISLNNTNIRWTINPERIDILSISFEDKIIEDNQPSLI